MERRLSAILAADVVGYSRLMGANEVGTLTALNNHRAELIDPTIAAHQGRIVKLTGDGMLVEFPSVVGAVECAASIQKDMRVRNADIPEDRRIELRIGINLGDVIVEGDDIFGDGVNIAARIESVGRPGGVAISSSVRDHIGNKLDFTFEDMGEQDLKNIDRPVRVYELVTAASPVKGAACVDGSAACGDKPSIAVLPFTNMSGDPEQEYFSDGITEDIITDLSKISGLFVVGRHTSFSYKGTAIQLPRVARELGVKHLLEGSVRKAGGRVRITGQLIDGPTGGHVWADRYDRDLTDIFAIQDEITKTIVDQLKVRLLPEEQSAICCPPTVNVAAYQCYLKGRHFFHNATRTFLEHSRQMFVLAIEADPDFARAYAGLAVCDSRLSGWYDAQIPVDQMLANADRALSLDPNLADAHAARGDALSISGRDDMATDAFERALALDSANFEANFLYARHAFKHDDDDRAIALFRRALEVKPDDAQAPLLLAQLLRSQGRIEESEEYGRLGLARAEQALRDHPECSRPAQLGATTLASMGQPDRARQWLARAMATDPGDTLVLYNGACVLALLGDSGPALDLLETWSRQSGRETAMWLEQDSDLDSLREMPRFKALMATLHARPPITA